MNKRKELMIVSQHTIYKDRKSVKHCWSWTTYKHEHELNFDHSQNHVRNHDMKYEISEISNVAENIITELHLLAIWKSWWNSQLVLDHNQEWTCEFQKSFSEQLKAI